MQSLSYSKQKVVIIVLFLFIPLTLLLLFSYYPALKLFQLSFTNWDGASRELHYIGFLNFKEILSDFSTLMTFQNNFAYLGISLIQTFLALYLAILLNGKIRARNFFRSALFMPYILNGIAVAFMFSYMYDFDKGPLNILLRSIGLGQYSVRWLSESYFSNFSLALIGMWRYTGMATVIFLGALQSISKELFEAADLDGANFYYKIKHIILPSIKTVLELNLFLSVNGALQAFFEPFVITKGGPAGRTDTFVTSTVNVAFQFQNFGKASAMAVILLILVVIVLGIQRKILGDKDEAR